MFMGSVAARAQSESNDGQFYDLKRSYACDRDEAKYGRFYVWGYWKGGRWCGHTMPSGYYVYKDGIWFVWRYARD